jgi:tetratricopeptide (TPR) repeat protein/protein involved in polysaccharide export with SLBB domain
MSYLKPSILCGVAFSLILTAGSHAVTAELRTAEQARNAFEKGRLSLDAREFDSAINKFSEVIRFRPFAEAYYNRGIAYARKGEQDKAIADYTEAIRLNPSSPSDYEARAIAFIGRGEYERAVNDLQAVFRLNPTDPAASFEPWRKAQVAADALQHGERQIRQMLKDRPNMGRFGEKANVLLRWAARKFAGEDLHEMIFWNPSDPSPDITACSRPPTADEPGVIRVRGTIIEGPDKGKARSFEEMWCNAVFELYNIANSKQVDQIDDDVTKDMFSREEYVTKLIEVESGAAEKTRSFYIHVFLPWAIEHGVATDPRPWYLAERLSPGQLVVSASMCKNTAYWRFLERRYDRVILDSLVEKGDNDKAIALATRMQEEAKEEEEKVCLFNARGRAYGNQGRHEKAIADFGEALHLYPNCAVAYLNRGIVYTRLGDLDKAVADENEAIRLKPRRAAAYTARASAYGRKGDMGRAIADCTEAIRLKPKYALAYYMRAIAYENKGEKQKAEQDYAQAKKLGYMAEKEPKNISPTTSDVSQRTEPYRILPLDVLAIHAEGTLPNQPIDGQFLVEPSGQLSLGPAYGRVQLKGMTLEEAQAAAKKQLAEVLMAPSVRVSAAGHATRWPAEPPKAPYHISANDLLKIEVMGTVPDHPIWGTYLVEPNGEVPLGPMYGDVQVKGLAPEDAERAISKKLEEVLSSPDVSVTLAGWKSERPSSQDTKRGPLKTDRKRQKTGLGR